jgi:hypothetical protein
MISEERQVKTHAERYTRAIALTHSGQCAISATKATLQRASLAPQCKYSDQRRAHQKRRFNRYSRQTALTAKQSAPTRISARMHQDSGKTEWHCISHGIVIKPYQALDASVARCHELEYSTTMDHSDSGTKQRVGVVRFAPERPSETAILRDSETAIPRDRDTAIQRYRDAAIQRAIQRSSER